MERVPVSLNSLIDQLAKLVEDAQSTPGEKKVYAKINNGKLEFELFVKDERK